VLGVDRFVLRNWDKTQASTLTVDGEDPKRNPLTLLKETPVVRCNLCVVDQTFNALVKPDEYSELRLLEDFTHHDGIHRMIIVYPVPWIFKSPSQAQGNLAGVTIYRDDEDINFLPGAHNLTGMLDPCPG